MRKLSVQQLVSLDGHILEQESEFWGWWAGQPEDDESGVVELVYEA